MRRAGARLVVFPELSLTGYDLAAPPVAVDDPRLDPIRAACGSAGAIALVGAPVREDDGREYIATLAVTGESTTVAYRKMHLHGEEVLRFAPGEKPAVLEIDGWRLGLAIVSTPRCRSTRPTPRRLTIDAYVAGTLYGAGPRSAARRDGHMRDRAVAHGVWVVLSTAAGPSGEYRETSGGSGVWAPDGDVFIQAGTEPDAG